MLEWLPARDGNLPPPPPPPPPLLPPSPPPPLLLPPPPPPAWRHGVPAGAAGMDPHPAVVVVAVALTEAVGMAWAEGTVVAGAAAAGAAAAAAGAGAGAAAAAPTAAVVVAAGADGEVDALAATLGHVLRLAGTSPAASSWLFSAAAGAAAAADVSAAPLTVSAAAVASTLVTYVSDCIVPVGEPGGGGGGVSSLPSTPSPADGEEERIGGDGSARESDAIAADCPPSPSLSSAAVGGPPRHPVGAQAGLAGTLAASEIGVDWRMTWSLVPLHAAGEWVLGLLHVAVEEPTPATVSPASAPPRSTPRSGTAGAPRRVEVHAFALHTRLREMLVYLRRPPAAGGGVEMQWLRAVSSTTRERLFVRLSGPPPEAESATGGPSGGAPAGSPSVCVKSGYVVRETRFCPLCGRSPLSRCGCTFPALATGTARQLFVPPTGGNGGGSSSGSCGDAWSVDEVSRPAALAQRMHDALVSLVGEFSGAFAYRFYANGGGGDSMLSAGMPVAALPMTCACRANPLSGSARAAAQAALCSTLTGGTGGGLRLDAALLRSLSRRTAARRAAEVLDRLLLALPDGLLDDFIDRGRGGGGGDAGAVLPADLIGALSDALDGTAAGDSDSISSGDIRDMAGGVVRVGVDRGGGRVGGEGDGGGVDPGFALLTLPVPPSVAPPAPRPVVCVELPPNATVIHSREASSREADGATIAAPNESSVWATDGGSSSVLSEGAAKWLALDDSADEPPSPFVQDDDGAPGDCNGDVSFFDAGGSVDNLEGLDDLSGLLTPPRSMESLPGSSMRGPSSSSGGAAWPPRLPGAALTPPQPSLAPLGAAPAVAATPVPVTVASKTATAGASPPFPHPTLAVPAPAGGLPSTRGDPDDAARAAAAAARTARRQRRRPRLAVPSPAVAAAAPSLFTTPLGGAGGPYFPLPPPRQVVGGDLPVSGSSGGGAVAAVTPLAPRAVPAQTPCTLLPRLLPMLPPVPLSPFAAGPGMGNGSVSGGGPSPARGGVAQPLAPATATAAAAVAAAAAAAAAVGLPPPPPPPRPMSPATTRATAVVMRNRASAAVSNAARRARLVALRAAHAAAGEHLAAARARHAEVTAANSALRARAEAAGLDVDALLGKGP
ncbi:hypothetical protein MMPV_003892 [Pyropia vietnamensis]